MTIAKNGHAERLPPILPTRVGRVISRRVFKSYVLKAYHTPNGRQRRALQSLHHSIYGLSTVESQCLPELHSQRSFVWNSQSQLFDSGVRISLGAQPLGFGGLQIYCESDSVLESNTYLFGFYDELPLLATYKILLSGADTAIDVGANVGVHSLALAHSVTKSGHVHAIEPRTVLTEKLRTNLQLNSISNVTIHECAAHSQDTVVSFFEDADNFNQGVGHVTSSGTLPVRACTIDSLGVGRAHLIKIDVEGGEVDVLKGASELLATNRPFIVVEHNSPSWSLEELLSTIPFESSAIRVPNTFDENFCVVAEDSELKGFNNLLIVDTSDLDSLLHRLTSSDLLSMCDPY